MTYAPKPPRVTLEPRNLDRSIQKFNVNALVRAGMALAAEADVHVSVSRVTKTVKRALAQGGYVHAQDALGRLLNRTWRGSWVDFELFVNGYADPTGAHAARNVDNSRESR